MLPGFHKPLFHRKLGWDGTRQDGTEYGQKDFSREILFQMWNYVLTIVFVENIILYRTAKQNKEKN